MVAISAEYRIKSLHKTSPVESLKDAKSAIRWVRKNAAELGVDPEKIIAGGGSAGGHLAAACGTMTTIEEEVEKGGVCSMPNAMVLFNPVLDCSPEGFGNDRLIGKWEEFSPLHNINSECPPSIIFLGTEDDIIPVATAENFKKTMADAGIDCKLFLYEGQAHCFFNYKEEGNIYFNKTVVEMDKFLGALGYITGKPTMTVPEEL